MLVVSIHDVAPVFLSEVRTLRARLSSWGVGAVTLLAVPDHHAVSPLGRSPWTVGWLRERIDAGDEVALHGFHHRQEGPIRARWDRLRARLLTAGEGEMLAVPMAAAPGLVGRGRALLADLLGREPAGFVAPAWLEPRGLGRVLAASGFAWHESSLWVEDLRAGRRIASPVLGWATRSRWREQAAVAWARVVGPAASRLGRATGVVRVALHPGDLHSAVVMGSIERTVRALVARHPAATTAGALALA
jgi:predicted deacetylase